MRQIDRVAIRSHAPGRLTRIGRKELRTAMVQAAHIARMTHPHWQEKYSELIERMNAMKAVTAITRMLFPGRKRVQKHPSILPVLLKSSEIAPADAQTQIRA